MEKKTLGNGVKLLYKKAENTITSFTIGFNAGANQEHEENLGIAHILEHMLFKGTTTRSEYEINKLCDETFGFCNAMTNYPYVVYYGTSLDEDFEKGFELYSDIILNPSFQNNGFKEEIEVICEELKEWKDDLYQHCEDSMLSNGFEKRRIKNLIIGTEESIRAITMKQIISFYEKYYVPKNCVVSVVSSMSLDAVSGIVEKYLGAFKEKVPLLDDALKKKEEITCEGNKPGTYFQYKNDIEGAKMQICFSIKDLNQREVRALKLFNLVFGEGTSSILYDEIRTKRGLVYDISSKIKNETGIKLFTITLGTSRENVHKTIEIINSEIEKVKKYNNYFNKELILKLCKNYKLRRILAMEKSIQISVSLCTYEIMYGDGFEIFSEFEQMESITDEEIMEVINKVLVNATIQVLMPVKA